MDKVIYVLIGWNVVTFLLMGIDKYKSIHNKWRIKESTLLTAAFAMGGLGGLAGSLVFRHKTKTWKFKILLPVALIFNISLVYLIYYYVL